MKNSRRDARSPFPNRGAARIAAVFLCLGTATGSTHAAPTVSRQSYSISDFDTIRLDAPIEVMVVTGKGVAATGTGDRDTLDTLVLEVNSRTLAIRMRDRMMLGGTGGRARAPTRLTLTTNEVKRATVMGAGNLTIDRMRGARIGATLNGGGRLTVLNTDSDRIDLGQAGAGTMTVSGKTIELIASVSGSGRLDASALDAQRLRIETDGSAEALLNARQEASANASGTGQIIVTGKATCTVRKIGSASVTCGGAVY